MNYETKFQVYHLVEKTNKEANFCATPAAKMTLHVLRQLKHQVVIARKTSISAMADVSLLLNVDAKLRMVNKIAILL